MKKRLIILVFFVFAFLSLQAGSEQIRSFDELMTALKNGEEVKSVIHYAKTKLIIEGEETEAPDAIGGMELSTFEYFAKGVVRNEKAYVASSKSVLIGHPFYGHVYNYVKLRIYEDGEVEIIARYLDPITFEVKMDETFYSVINNGENESGFYLFAD